MNKKVEKKLVLKKSIKIALNKFLITIIIFLIGLISIKANPNLKKVIRENFYEKNIKFSRMKTFYEKHFGKLLSLDKVSKNTIAVFNEKLAYNRKTPYENGVKLDVTDNYMVPALESGVVVFVGKKEKLGSTIIVEQVNGVDTFYSNIKLDNIKLYDYIEKGSFLGETKSNKLYLAFQKNGEYLDYQKYL